MKINISKFTYTTFLLFAFNLFANSQTKNTEHGLINWLTLPEAEKLNAQNPKPMFIDVYTDWCGWCKRMSATTFSVPGIANYINTNFYPVRLNAESHDTLTFKGEKYINKNAAKKSSHDLAIKLLNGRMSYPTIVYIDVKGNISPVPGFMKSKDIEPILIYFAEDLPATNFPFDEFSSYFMHVYKKTYQEELKKATIIPDTTGNVKWYSPKEASELSLKNNKPLYIFFYTNWNQSSKIEQQINFKNPEIAKLLNENFYPVKVDAASKDSLILYGQTFKGAEQTHPHQLAQALLQQNFKVPAEVFISPKKEKLNEIHGYMPPVRQESILLFFAKNAYLTQNYQEFLKTFKSKIKIAK